MNDPAHDHDEMDDRLAQFRLSRPPADHRQKVLDAAQAAWSEPRPALASTSSAKPLVWLATSIAASVLIVVFANAAAVRTLARWAPQRRPATPEARSSPDVPNLGIHGFANCRLNRSGMPLRGHWARSLTAHRRHLRELLEQMAEESRRHPITVPDRQGRIRVNHRSHSERV